MAPNREAIDAALNVVCGAEYVNLRFIDLPGAWLALQIPAEKVTEELFEEGLGFDGSSIRGWKPINDSDMILVPDAESIYFTEHVANFICDIKDPITGKPYDRDPRYVAYKAEQTVKQMFGKNCVANFGPEVEFFVFDNVEWTSEPQSCGFNIISSEAGWNDSGEKVRFKRGYYAETLASLRNEMMKELDYCGLDVELAHHEVGTAGQCEISIRYNSLLRKADETMKFKAIVREVARKHNKLATFMPKPLFKDNGSGMHCHQSIWNGKDNLFSGDNGDTGLSVLAEYYIGGILRHARALAALTNPSTNSYRRLVPGYEAPTTLAYSCRNRSAAVRIPASSSEMSRRIEVRFPDASCNPYLAFSAMLMAGLDGILNKIDPGQTIDKDIFEMSRQELESVAKLPGSLDEALRCLKQDHEFLTRNNVFSQDLIESWIEYKQHEVDDLRKRTHPREFHLYFDV